MSLAFAGSNASQRRKTQSSPAGVPVSDFENLDYYELLGVSRSAPFDEIKRAYRREISKYHPDRFANAMPHEQAYASERSQRITEAYSILSDTAARSAYTRGQALEHGARGPRPAAVPQQRDHQAELYDQALDHLKAGRLLQAVGTLRQLQQINPFYRNSAELLAQVEAQLNQRSERPARRFSPLILAGGMIGGVVVLALVAWMLGFGRGATAARAPTSTAAPIAAVATPLATTAPAPTAAPPTAAPPTAVSPTQPPPTARPTVAPTATPPPAEPTTVGAEQGQILVADSFAGPGWADLRGPVWQVGYQNRRYRVQGEAGSGAIWSYRTMPAKDASIGVDLQVANGEGGLMLRFLDANNYLSVVLNPSQTSYRIEQQRGGALNALAGGQSGAINAGTDAINRLVVRVRGNTMQVFVNGQQLAEASANDAPDSARYGLLVLAKDTAAEAFFDNLEIRTLE